MILFIFLVMHEWTALGVRAKELAGRQPNRKGIVMNDGTSVTEYFSMALHEWIAYSIQFSSEHWIFHKIIHSNCEYNWRTRDRHRREEERERVCLCANKNFILQNNFRSVHEFIINSHSMNCFHFIFTFSAFCWKCTFEQIIASFLSQMKKRIRFKASPSPRPYVHFGGKWVSASQTNLFALIHSISI